MMGGIGNQMFQYALGYNFKNKFGKQVQFDISFYQQADYSNTTKRELEIEAFALTGFNKIDELNLNKLSKIANKVKTVFLPYYKHLYVNERYYGFDPNIFKINSNACLNGFWQSPSYFEGLEKPIREQFFLKKNLSYDAKCYSDLIKASNISISIHIRRGDYLSTYSHIFCNQSPGYYSDGLNYIKQKINSNDVMLFIFSDDIEWCKKNVNYPFKTIFVSSAKMFSYEDMILMSQCNHNIIANSSYSWWGAWLNNNLEKVVICPNAWYKNDKTNATFTKDLFPASWIRL